MVQSYSEIYISFLGASIANMLKETSEAVVRNTGYTFDERTGLYYDHKSGYYYDPENQLFYEPKTGTYYKYNSETGEYTNYTASEDDAMNSKFKEFAHPVYAHLLKKMQQRHKAEKENDHGYLSKTVSRHSRSTSSDIGHRRRRRSRGYSGSHCCRSYYKRGRESPSFHRHTRRRQKSYRSSYRSGSSRSDESLYKRKKHRRRKHSHRRRHKSSSTGSVCSHKSRNSTHSKKRRKRKHKIHRESSDSTSCSSNPLKQKRKPLDKEEVVTSFSGDPVVYPPCVRLMVLASQYTQPGQLFIITSQESIEGKGCIGQSFHLCPQAYLTDDPEISELQCEVIYDTDTRQYSLLDRGSNFSTTINGITLPKCKSSILCHGDIIRLGSTRLLVHIHNGNETCGQCDPDEIKAALTSIVDVSETINSANHKNTENLTGTIPTPSSKDAERRAKLDEIKKKYGLKFPRIRPQAKTDKQYMDRAAQRRAIEANLKAAGYPLPPAPGVIIHQINKTPLITRPTPASVHKPIGDENKGAKLLAKMGWTPGQGLGKSKTGISEPITVNLRINPQAGLGSSNSSKNTISIDSTPKELTQAYIRAKTKERFDKLS
ncbi:unnamed protein product [Schistosoma rodhaini]|uniref:G-patch domain-containing protein n=1 Tax=Schistosoma rodhaini TaxID=6188 RepID=A0AA85FTK9_9TREM|nr:unnamed protein product [Schistosoma rodhaini]